MRRAGAEYLCSHRDCSLRDAVLPLRLLVAVLPHRRPGQDPPCQQSCRGSGRIHVSQERCLLFKNKKIAVHGSELWFRIRIRIRIQWVFFLGRRKSLDPDCNFWRKIYDFFFSCIFFQYLVIKTLGPDSYPDPDLLECWIRSEFNESGSTTLKDRQHSLLEKDCNLVAMES